MRSNVVENIERCRNVDTSDAWHGHRRKWNVNLSCGQEAIGTVPELCSSSFTRSSNRIATILHHVRGEKSSAIKTATRIGEDLMRDRLSDSIVQILWLNGIVCVCNGRHCDQHTTRWSLDRESILKLDRKRNIRIREKHEIGRSFGKRFKRKQIWRSATSNCFKKERVQEIALNGRKMFLLVLNS